MLDKQQANDLNEEIANFHSTYSSRHGKNFFINVALVLLGILLAVGVTAAGFFEKGKLAGILGLLLTLFIALQNAFYFNEKAEFYRLVATEADNLRYLLKFKVQTQSELHSVLDAFMTLKKYAATNLPRGKGMEVVKEMYANFPNQLQKDSSSSAAT
jgi:hypothetical protein